MNVNINILKKIFRHLDTIDPGFARAHRAVSWRVVETQ